MAKDKKAAQKPRAFNCACSWDNCAELSTSFPSHHVWSGCLEAKGRAPQKRLPALKRAAFRAGVCHRLGLDPGELKDRFKEVAKLASMGPSRKFFEAMVSGAAEEKLTYFCQEASLMLLADLCRCSCQEKEIGRAHV